MNQVRPCRRTAHEGGHGEIFSVWLMPAKPTEHELAALIADARGRYGGPDFVPHVTVIGGVCARRWIVEAAAERIASAMTTLDFQVAGPAQGDEYYRCCFLRLAEHRPLADARQEAISTFRLSPTDPYEPHVSILYGRVSLTDRQAWVATVDLKLPTRLEFDAIELRRTSGPPPAWSRAARFALSPK